MDYLRTLFTQALVQEHNFYMEDGRVYIRGYHWSPEEVIEGMLDKDVAENAFQDWVAERNEELIVNADDFLESFEVKDRFRMLSVAHNNGLVTPFVGAGLSISSGYKGWTDFLQQLKRQTNRTAEEVDNLITDGKYEEAAQLLADSLGPAFNEAIESAYGHPPDLMGPVEYLPYVFATCVITTNFDDILKRCYENANCPFDDVIPGYQAQQLPRAVASGRKLLIKLHGTSTTGHGRVLTAAEYEAHYDNANTFDKIIEVFSSRTLLFIGCSLSVDRTLRHLKQYIDEKGHDNVARHYAFLENPGSSNKRNTRRDQLAECNIYPIWYPEGMHDESIEALLTKLKAEAT